MNHLPTHLDVYLSFLFLAGGALFASLTISKRFLHFFQQDEYDNKRFLRWWLQSGAWEKRATLLTLLFSLSLGLSESRGHISTLPLWRDGLLSFLMALSIAWAGWSNKPGAVKKELVMTSRAKRVWVTNLVLQGLFLLCACIAFHLSPLKNFHLLYMTLLIAAVFLLTPLFLVLGNLLLSPVESVVQKKYLQEAREKLSRIKPEVIGITGSYGKTSFKHILSHIMNFHAPVLTTPGSVNTLMGITRIIRERLRNDHAYFIVEMGAYGIGSIQRLCELTPPQAAIVTAIGIAHMERFKTIETVLHAKTELPRAVPEDGCIIFNGDDPNLRKAAGDFPQTVLFYGRDANQGHLDCRLIETETTEAGTSFSIEYDKKIYNLSMPIHGEHQAMNATGAFLAAMQFGMPPLSVIAALQTLPTIAHRLVVHKREDGITVIDDAYNSNPVGFRNALHVLQQLNGHRKILVTPGMVELGGQAEEAYRGLAEQAGRVCDEILLVAAHRLTSFHDALIEQIGSSDHVHSFETLADAQSWLNHEWKAGDVVLYENDLPDLYETRTVFSLM